VKEVLENLNERDAARSRDSVTIKIYSHGYTVLSMWMVLRCAGLGSKGAPLKKDVKCRVAVSLGYVT